jgi:hypothetical protein
MIEHDSDDYFGAEIAHLLHGELLKDNLRTVCDFLALFDQIDYLRIAFGMTDLSRMSTGRAMIKLLERLLSLRYSKHVWFRTSHHMGALGPPIRYEGILKKLPQHIMLGHFRRYLEPLAERDKPL